MPYKLLVIGSSRINYYEVFKDCTVLGEKVEVDQCRWEEMSICSFADCSTLVVTIDASPNPIKGTPQESTRVFHPNFVLLRAGCRGNARTDWRFKLSVLAHNNVPSVNSIQSFWNSQDKAILYGKLLAVKQKMGGFKNFPLIPQTAYSDWKSAGFPPDTPAVAKIGTASGGLGKMKIETTGQWDDFCSISQMQNQFFASEPFIDWEYDIRVQKIGSHYRAFRRTSKHWKSNVDIATKTEDIEVEDRYKIWIDAGANECGMDICAMDIITQGDQEYILELNSSAIGLHGDHTEEDCEYIKELVLRRMKEAFSKKKQKKKKTKEEQEFLREKVRDLENEVEALTQQLKSLQMTSYDAEVVPKTRKTKPW
eukprot:CAMPEP_0174254486 /NCGR_PEP_ID=MMETSP0439-20130205/3798_1 /TAXON_ID=0 /ORGANISM="Stereomyxa ramosa, Strain Chinc5" /LENGTH=366 /DNA_ID=CAMNT_0015336089 /DNA_START=8 /DNA_END=1105 /DNA_ORIENTATION=+